MGALTKLVNVMAGGGVPKESAPFIFGGNLFALLKKSGGLRPVAVGDILRRLTSKTLAYAVASRAAKLLQPLQFGVGVRGGCEAVVHATRTALAREDEPQHRKWTLQVDLENGFNNTNRSEMMAEVRKHMPELSHWVESSYGSSSHLNFGSNTIKSTTGEHQGDPLSGLLFAFTLQPVLKMLRNIPDLTLNSWFLDDGELAGSKEALVAAWDILVTHGVPRGLILSRVKSRVHCQGHDQLDTDPLGRGVTRGEDRGFKLLGAPVGSWEFEKEVLEGRLAGVQQLLDKLHTLQDPHMEYTLLRSCFSFSKMAYSMRTVDVSQHEEFLVRFDQAVRGALEGILGAPLTPAQWTQASLPLAMGGLGLRQAEQHGPAAYLISYSTSQPLVREMLDGRTEDIGEEGSTGRAEEARRTEAALRSLNQQLGDNLTYEGVSNLTQRWLSAQIDTESSHRLFQATTSVREQARLNCVAREGASDWLRALPSKALGLHLRSGEFLFGVKYRLGLPVFREEGQCPAPHCKGVSDMYGDHAISCAIGGERIARHSHLRDVVYQTAQQAHLGPRKEPDGLLPGTDERPADVLLPYWTHGRDTAIDVTVVNALQAALVGRVATDGGHAVAHSHSIKVKKYEARCEAEGIIFVPLALDTFGGYHRVALEAIGKLGRQLARVVGRDEGETVQHLRQRLSVVLIRDNMNMLASRAPEAAPSQISGQL